MPVLAGNLEIRRKFLELRMGEEDAQVLAEQAVADVVMPIAVGAERRLWGVLVQHAEAIEADLLIDLDEHLVQLLPTGDFVAGHVKVAGVEADAEPLVLPEGCVER